MSENENSLEENLKMASSTGDPPIRKTNCWSGMAFVASSDCR